MRSMMVGEEQQPERDLGDDERLREREELRDAAARVAAPARPERSRPTAATHTPITRNAFTWWAVSIDEKPTERIDRGRRRQARARFRAAERQRRDRQALRPARQAGRPLLLSQGRHAGLHDPGVRDPRRLRRVRARGRGRARRLTRRRARRTSSSRRSTTCRSRCSPTPTTRSPSTTASGARRSTWAAPTWASTARPS